MTEDRRTENSLMAEEELRRKSRIEMKRRKRIRKRANKEAWQTGTRFLRVAIVLTSIAGAVLLADLIAFKVFGYHLYHVLALIGAVLGLLSAIRQE